MFHRNKKAEQQYQELAGSWGMTYAPKDKVLRKRDFELFLPPNRNVRNVISGQWRGRNLAVFDYWFHEVVMRGSRPGLGRKVGFTCAVADLASPVPPTRFEGHPGYGWVRPPKGMTELEAVAGVKVLAADPVSGQSLLSKDLKTWLAKEGEGWAFELNEGGVLCSCGPKPAAEWPQVLDKLSDFLALLPAGTVPAASA